MMYLTGQFALNLPCDLKTCGDWHTTALRWSNIKLIDSSLSIYGDYGIEKNKKIPEHSGYYNVANHIRAILDLLVVERFDLITNFNNDYICNDDLTNEIFEKIYVLLPNENIYNFIYKTYGSRWRKWIMNYNIKK